MTAQGTRSNNRPHLVEDLDTLITSRMLRPAKVKFGGREWTIKRDFTPDQIFKFWTLVEERKTAEAFALLVGTKDGAELAALVSAMPVEIISPPLRRLYQLAGLLKRPDDTTETGDSDSTGDPEGESSAS